MARMQIVADARWVTRAIANIVTLLAVLLLAVYLCAGKWWTIAATIALVLTLVSLWRVIRR